MNRRDAGMLIVPAMLYGGPMAIVGLLTRSVLWTVLTGLGVFGFVRWRLAGRRQRLQARHGDVIDAEPAHAALPASGVAGAVIAALNARGVDASAMRFLPPKHGPEGWTIEAVEPNARSLFVVNDRGQVIDMRTTNGAPKPLPKPSGWAPSKLYPTPDLYATGQQIMLQLAARQDLTMQQRTAEYERLYRQARVAAGFPANP